MVESQKDKDTAAAACSEIMATRNFESARRVSVYNAARMNLGISPSAQAISFDSIYLILNLFFPPDLHLQKQKS